MTAKEWVEINSLKDGDEIKIIKAPASNNSHWDYHVGKIYCLNLDERFISKTNEYGYSPEELVTIRYRDRMDKDFDRYPINCLEIVNKQEEYVYKRKSLLNWRKEENE